MENRNLPVHPDMENRSRSSSVDLLTMPELALAAETTRPSDLALATRSLVSRIVAIDAETFGVNLQYQTQNYMLVCSGRRVQIGAGLSRSTEPGLVSELSRSAQEVSDVSQLLYWFGTFNRAGRTIAGLVSVFENMSTDTMLFPDVFKRVFNLPAVPGVDRNEVLGRPLGEDIDKVVRACIVVGVCEDKAKLKKLMSKPGWKLLFDNDDDTNKYVGNVDQLQDKRTHKSLKEEEHIRGDLIKNGNLWARPETSEEANQFEAILTEIAGGNELAVSLGVGLFKIFAMDSEYAAIKFDKDGKETILLEGWPNSGDIAKLMHFAKWQVKQGSAGHACGPRDTRGQTRSLLLPFLKFAGYKTDADDEGSMRSIYEKMWGYNDPEGNVEEDGLRLGEVDWGKLPPSIWNQWGTRIVVPGGEKGLFNLLKAEKSDSDAMMTDTFWEMLRLNLNVVVSKGLLCGGVYKSSKITDEAVEAYKQKIVKRFWQGVTTLPDFDIWKSQPVDENAHKPKFLGLNTPTKKIDFVKRVARYAGFSLK